MEKHKLDLMISLKKNFYINDTKKEKKKKESSNSNPSSHTYNLSI